MSFKVPKELQNFKFFILKYRKNITEISPLLPFKFLLPNDFIFKSEDFILMVLNNKV
jgi:hypothetical protein